MYRSLFPVLLLAGAIALAGCVQTQATMLDSERRPALEPEDVRIYRAVENITCDYDEVALVHAQGGATYTNEHQMIEAARRRAARVGANGVVLGEIDEPSAGARIAGAVFGVQTERRGRLLAVFVHDCEPDDDSDE